MVLDYLLVVQYLLQLIIRYSKVSANSKNNDASTWTSNVGLQSLREKQCKRVSACALLYLFYN